MANVKLILPAAPGSNKALAEYVHQVLRQAKQQLTAVMGTEIDLIIMAGSTGNGLANFTTSLPLHLAIQVADDTMRMVKSQNHSLGSIQTVGNG